MANRANPNGTYQNADMKAGSGFQPLYTPPQNGLSRGVQFSRTDHSAHNAAFNGPSQPSDYANPSNVTYQPAVNNNSALTMPVSGITNFNNQITNFSGSPKDPNAMWRFPQQTSAFHQQPCLPYSGAGNVSVGQLSPSSLQANNSVNRLAPVGAFVTTPVNHLTPNIALNSSSMHRSSPSNAVIGQSVYQQLPDSSTTIRSVHQPAPSNFRSTEQTLQYPTSHTLQSSSHAYQSDLMGYQGQVPPPRSLFQPVTRPSAPEGIRFPTRQPFPGPQQVGGNEPMMTPPPRQLAPSQGNPPRGPPKNIPSLGVVNGLPVPFHGQGQYSHQIGSAVSKASSTPEPNLSQKSSRSGSPMVTQNFDALEGGLTPDANSSQPNAMQVPTPTTLGFGAPVTHGPAGKRHYPPMPGVTDQPSGYPYSLSQSGTFQSPGVPNTFYPGYNSSSVPSPGMNLPRPPAMLPPPTQLGPPLSQPEYNLIPQPPLPAQPPPLNTSGLNSSLASMNIQEENRIVNLMQERHLIPATGVETPKPVFQNEFKGTNICNPEIFRCTLNAVPQTSALLNKARLPLGILIHPFKDLSQLPVIQSSVIVRCRSCRTYINPFVTFESERSWKCNVCFRSNAVPDEFSFDPVSKTYGHPQRRPEVKSSTIEFIAPSEYMLRPPQPAVYFYLLDVSFNAIETGYLQLLCETILEELDKIPGDSRTQIGFLAYDRVLYFFNLSEGLSQPQMLIVSDVEDIFLPCPDGLLVNLSECKDLVIDLLSNLPTIFESNKETASAAGAAMQAAFKIMSPTGGRVTVFQTILPTVGPGALQPREDPNLRASTKVENLGPATDFYKCLALDCSAQQVAVDLFMMNGQYSDIASLASIAKFSGGSLYYYPSFHSSRNISQKNKFEADLTRYLTRKIGFEAVMRIRCTKGLSIHTFHGNFFVRSTDLLSLPNINPEAGFGMQMAIEDSLTDSSVVSFQAALLYTSSKGERRIRVHTLCLPVTTNLGVIFAQADQFAITSLVAKMASDRTVKASISEAKEAMITSVVDAFEAFSKTLSSTQRIGNLHCPYSLRLLPMYMLALIKFMAFRTGISTRLDDRLISLECLKTLPVSYLIKTIYPSLYPVHTLEAQPVITKNDKTVPNPPQLQLSSASLDRHGVYVLDAVDKLVMLIGAAVSDQFCQDVFSVPNYCEIPDNSNELLELDNPTSERIRNFMEHMLNSRPPGATFDIIKEDSKQRSLFFSHMIEDRTESSMSYYEFLQYIQKQIAS